MEFPSFGRGCALVYWWFSFQRLRMLNTLVNEVHGITPNFGLGSKMGNLNRENLNEDDPQFKEECEGWDVNKVVFTPQNWQVYEGLMRDDFTLFDEYEYKPATAKFDMPSCMLRQEVLSRQDVALGASRVPMAVAFLPALGRAAADPNLGVEGSPSGIV